MAAGPISERNQDATVYVGGLDEKVSEPLLWELFLQAGPVVNTHMPKDRVTGQHQGYGFVEFLSEEDADYAIKIMNMIKLYGKPIRVNKASAHNKNLDVGANIFIGNLDPEIDEKLLYDTFSAFGVILQTPKIMRDPDTGNSKGYAFINFASFDASDAAIEAMNGQYLCNRPITVSYAFKKDSKGERHGSAAERLLAAQNPLSQADRPHQLFADAPPPPSAPNPVVSSLGSGLPPPGEPPPPLGGWSPRLFPLPGGPRLSLTRSLGLRISLPARLALSSSFSRSVSAALYASGFASLRLPRGHSVSARLPFRLRLSASSSERLCPRTCLLPGLSLCICMSSSGPVFLRLSQGVSVSASLSSRVRLRVFFLPSLPLCVFSVSLSPHLSPPGSVSLRLLVFLFLGPSLRPCVSFSGDSPSPRLFPSESACRSLSWSLRDFPSGSDSVSLSFSGSLRPCPFSFWICLCVSPSSRLPSSLSRSLAAAPSLGLSLSGSVSLLSLPPSPRLRLSAHLLSARGSRWYLSSASWVWSAELSAGEGAEQQS
uniref:Splicing factor 3B subunit 4 n=4 Tax=Mammalia TaxID=40674 RepID=A0A6I8MZK0_ORNAN